MARVDIDEVIAFINAADIPNGSQQGDVCLSKMVQHINEPFLMKRASDYIDEYAHASPFKNAIDKLANICNADVCSCNICPVSKYCNHFIANARISVKQNALRMIDLFCGAGGLSLGFTQEGFITSLANDIQECCVDTYAHNHPETPRDHIVLGDIREIVDNIEVLLPSEGVDIVVGGPPCQGFSEANRQRLIDDPRNKLYRNFVQVVAKARPPFFVMENVKGMSKVKQQVIDDFSAIGYRTSARVLNAKDFGVPQNRERLIYIGNRIGVDNESIFDEIVSYGDTVPNYVLYDAISDLRPLKALREKNATETGSHESGYLIERKSNTFSSAYVTLINQGRTIQITCNHKARYNNDRDIEIFGRMLPGDKSDDPKIADIMPYKTRSGIFKDKYCKLEPDKVCKTITAHMKFDCNMYIHPTQARGLTPREAARVQSYPDDYFFRGSYTKTYMQIGNSVPPLLGRAIARIVKKYVRR